MSAQRHWDWRARHAIRSARDGGPLPDLFFRRYRDTVEISWADVPLPGAEDVRFLAPFGRGRVEPVLVADAIHEVALDAARWLAAHVPQRARLAALVTRLEELPHAEREQRIAWLAGLGEESESALRRWRQLVDAVSSRWSGDAVRRTFEPDFSGSGLVVQGSAAAGLLFGSVAPTLADGDVLSLVELLLARFQPSASRPLDDYVRGEPLRFAYPAWDHGYELAVEVLDELFDGAHDHIDVEHALARLGVEVVEVALTDTQLRAVSFAGPDHMPTVAANTSSSYSEPPPARRFTLAHELCHLLFDRDEAADLAIASGPWAPRDLERRANAFAAMLLMPPWLIRQAEARVGDPVDSPEGAAKVAEVLGVSHGALVQHLFNLGIIDTPTRSLLRPDLADQG